MKQVQYVKYNKMRREQFQIKTQICMEDGIRFVEKSAVREQGVPTSAVLRIAMPA